MSYNIVLITVDCLRYDHTPLLRRVMSLRPMISFTGLYSPGTFTGFSIPSLLTGDYPPVILPRKSLPRELRRRGYITASLITNPLLLTSYGFLYDIRRDFDIFRYYPESVLSGKPISYKLQHISGVISRRKIGRSVVAPLLTTAALGLTNLLGFIINKMPPVLPYEKAPYILRDALRLLDGIRRPFFLWVHLNDLHQPIFCCSRNRLLSKKMSLVKAHLGDMVPFAATPYFAYKLHILYRQALRELDDVLYSFIRRATRDGRTIVVVTSDHGETFLEHGTIDHLPVEHV